MASPRARIRERKLVRRIPAKLASLQAVRKYARSPTDSLNTRGDQGDRLPTYVMLSTLTPEGVQTVKNNPSRIREVNHEVEQLGAKVVAQWAVLGRFDFVNIVEVPDDATMARVS